MIDSQKKDDSAEFGYNDHLLFNKRDNRFIKNIQEMLLDLANFTMQEQLEDNLINGRFFLLMV